MIHLVVAMDERQGIGLDGHLPWHITEDLQIFKRITLHQNIVMGRKTFESIGRILPQREHFVVSQDVGLFNRFPQLHRIENFNDFLKHHQASPTDFYVIGGARMYEAALPYAKNLHLSLIKGVYPCDTFFPSFDASAYHLVHEEQFEAFTYRVYSRENS